MYELIIKDHFAAAHFLREYQGKCESLHGHTYCVEATIQAGELDRLGMVADFKDLKEALNSIVDDMDHVCLNEQDSFKEQNPTTENIARHIFRAFAEKIKPLAVKQVRVWESESASAVYYE